VQPNVLLVVLDAARRDALEPYGAPAGSTPAIAQLASRGAALPEAYATACWTVPSHASFLTGLMPRAAGLSVVPSPAAAKPVVASHRERLLPELLRRAGYSTGAVSANLWLSRASGFDVGFDDFESVDSGRDAHMHDPGRLAMLRWRLEAARGQVDDGAAAARRLLERWIDDPVRRPFFWLVNLIECHSPYLPPRPYGGASRRERMRAAHHAQWHFNLNQVWRACVGGYDLPEETIELARRLYAGAIRYMDDWLAAVLESLDAAGALDDTLVVVLSDHGENFGEGGLLAHALSLDDRLLHVPFVIAGPGAREARLESLANLPAMLAGLVGLEEHPWRDGPPPGVGVAQFDPPAQPGDPRAAETVERWGLGEDALRRLTTPLTCAVSDGLKLVEADGRELVYDLALDPLELQARAPEDLTPERQARLRKLRAALRHPSVTARRAEEASAVAAGEPTAEELSEIEERMRMLGYM
jgi:arylsulfatase A-like enzyme